MPSVALLSAGQDTKVVLTFVPMISRTDDWMSPSVMRLMWPLRTGDGDGGASVVGAVRGAFAVSPRAPRSQCGAGAHRLERARGAQGPGPRGPAGPPARPRPRRAAVGDARSPDGTARDRDARGGGGGRTLLVPNLQRPAAYAVQDGQEALLEGVLEHGDGALLPRQDPPRDDPTLSAAEGSSRPSPRALATEASRAASVASAW